MEIAELIEKMKSVKEANPTLEISDVLRIFNIQAIKELTREIRGLRIKYRYGEEVLNKKVEGICIRMVSIDLMTGDFRSVILPEGGSGNLSQQQRIIIWQDDIDRKMN